MDSSILMLSAELGKNLLEMAEKELDEKLELYTLEDVVRELKAIARGKGKRSKLARVALEIAIKFNIIECLEESSVDEKIIKVARELNMPIVTADSEMVREAKKKNVPILIFHRDMRITFEGWRP